MDSNLATIGGKGCPANSPHPIRTPKLLCVAVNPEIDCPLRPGVVPAIELGPTKSSCPRRNLEMRAPHSLEARTRFVSHPSFDDSNIAAEILGPIPGPQSDCKAPRKTGAAGSLSSFAALPRDSKFLTREQEIHLFRKMNFLKYQAAQLHKAIHPSRAHSSELERVEESLREAGAIRNRIVGSYLGLVVSIVKKCAGPCEESCASDPRGRTA